MSEEQTTVAEEQQTPTQSETPTSIPTPTQPINFIDSLPEDIRGEASLANIKDIDQLAKGYVHAQRMVGADKIGLPNQHSTDNDWNEVYSKLGRPEAADQYEINYQVPVEGMEATNLPGYQEAAHAAGLNNSQAQKLIDWYSGLEKESLESTEVTALAARETAETDLRKEYGLAYDKKLSQADGIFSKFFGSDFASIKLEDGSLLGDNATFIKSLVSLSSNFSEDTVTADQTSSGAMTPNEANAEISKITAPNSPYWDKMHPQHQATVDQVFQLRQMAHPDSVE
tara:strand:+ start:357 stop:1208 length:852 start_codon:yes stop_codon:yes gene_type:complete